MMVAVVVVVVTGGVATYNSSRDTVAVDMDLDG